MLAPFARLVAAFALILAVSSTPLLAEGPGPKVGADGIVKVKSSYAMGETIARLKQDIAAKGIVFFLEVDQAKLAGEAGIKLPPSTLLIFGNPGLGSHFITAKAEAGLDWPVRLLVSQNAKGEVWMSYTDFAWIARRHKITNREKEFAMATAVVTSITSAAKSPGM